jgi:hypothetical protein
MRALTMGLPSALLPMIRQASACSMPAMVVLKR